MIEYVVDDQAIYALGKTDAGILFNEICVEHCYEKFGVEIKEGMLIVDVGANIGVFEHYLHRNFENVIVHALEPVKPIFEVLQKNAERWNNPNIIIHSIGLGDKPRLVPFVFYPRMSQGSSSDSSLVDFNLEGQQDYILGYMKYVPLPRSWKRWIAERIRRWYLKSVVVMGCVFTLSLFISKQHIPRIDLLKIDVEGDEEKVLAGIEESDWLKIQQIIVECHYGLKQEWNIKRLLENKGFTVQSGSNPTFPDLTLLYGVRERRSSYALDLG